MTPQSLPALLALSEPTSFEVSGLQMIFLSYTLAWYYHQLLFKSHNFILLSRVFPNQVHTAAVLLRTCSPLSYSENITSPLKQSITEISGDKPETDTMHHSIFWVIPACPAAVTLRA